MKYVIRMSAGLANRMLQYTYYLYLKKIGYEVYLDNKYKATKWQMENINWEQIFPHANIAQASQSLIFRYGGGYNIFDKLRRHYLKLFNRVWIATDGTTIPSDEDLLKFRYFIGTYQDASIADFVKEEVLKAFSFSEFEEGSKNKELELKMKSENSVSIHFRKGKDYLSYTKFNNTCPIEYYQAAIDIICSKVKDPVFYVFTDNREWVEKNFHDVQYTIIDNNPAIGWGNHFDLQLMSSCKHNIIANSTYSWWGAYLNPNPDKIVINPKYWFNPALSKYKNLKNKTACKGWTLL